MKFFRSSYSFLTILIESIKLLPKNGKLMGFIALSSVFLSLFVSFLINYPLQDILSDMAIGMPDLNSLNSSDPTSFTPQTSFNPAQYILHLKEDLALLYAVEIASFLAFSTIFFFSTISTILASVSAKNLSLKELFSTIYRTWTRPLITSFYVSSLSIGYFMSVLILAMPLLMWPSLAIFWVSIFFGIPALIFYLYLIVPWNLSIVVSVVEESCYGIQALGKGAELVKGKRLLGFLLNIFFNLMLLIIFLGSKMLLLRKKVFATRPTISMMLLMSVLSLVNVFVAIAYTVFYVQCKEQNGEELELQGSLQYTKVPTTNDMP